MIADPVFATVTDIVAATQARIAATPSTDYAKGMLRGWVRMFQRDGFYYSVGSTNPLDPRPEGPHPTLAEWAAFDAEAQRLGVSGYVDGLRRNARPNVSTVAKVARETGRVVDQLDRYVPGWSTLLDAVGPVLPVIPIITNTIAWAARLAPLAAKPAFDLITVVAAGKPAIYQAPASVQDKMSGYLLGALQGDAAYLAPIRGTLTKFANTVAVTKGDLQAKIEAASIEALNGLALVVAVGCAFATAGTATAVCVSATAAVNALKAGVTLLNAKRAADAMKDAAKRQANADAAEAARLDAEAAALEAELRRLREAKNRRAPMVGVATEDDAAKAVALVAALVVASEVLS
jgi:hypothetical protein